MDNEHGSAAVTYHGLLFVEPGERPVNLPAGVDPLDTYVRCAATCARSVARTGARFRLITNAADVLAARFSACGLTAPALAEHAFAWAIPPLPFRAAHRKLELFGAFADGRYGARPALIDLDTVLLRPLDELPFAPGVLYGYDLTAQVVPAYGAGRLLADLAQVGGVAVAAPRWWGGEFVAGDPAAFAALADGVGRCWAAYLAAAPTLHHLGDEMVTSAALARLAARGAETVDLGGGVQRWWSNRTLAPQSVPLNKALGAALLHLPADKPFLARFADPARDLLTFPAAYRRHVRARWPAHRLLAAIAPLRADPRRYAPPLR